MSGDKKTKPRPKRKAAGAAAEPEVESVDEDEKEADGTGSTAAKKAKPEVPFRELGGGEGPAVWELDELFVGSSIEILCEDGLTAIRSNAAKPLKKQKSLIPETLMEKVTVVRPALIHSLVLRDLFPSCEVLCDLIKTHVIPLDELTVCEEVVSGGGGVSKTRSFVWVLRAYWQNEKGKVVRRDFRVTEPKFSVFDNNPDSPYGQMIDVFDPTNPLTYACANLFFTSVRGERITHSNPGDFYREAVQCGNRYSITCNGSTKHKDVPVVPRRFYTDVQSMALVHQKTFVREVWGVYVDSAAQVASFLVEPSPLSVRVFNMKPGRTDAENHYLTEDPELDPNASVDAIAQSIASFEAEDQQASSVARTKKKKGCSWADQMFKSFTIEDKHAVAEAARVALSESSYAESKQRRDRLLSERDNERLDSDLKSALATYRAVTSHRDIQRKPSKAFSMNNVEIALAALTKFSISSLANEPVNTGILARLTELGVMLKYRAAQRSTSMHPLQLSDEDVEGVLSLVKSGQYAWGDLALFTWKDFIGPLLLFMPRSLREEEAKTNPALKELYTALRSKLNTLTNTQTPDTFKEILEKAGLATVIRDVPPGLPPNTVLDPALAKPGLSRTLSQQMSADRLDQAALTLLELGDAAEKKKQALDEERLQEKKTRLRLEREQRDKEEDERIRSFIKLSESGSSGAASSKPIDEDEIGRMLADNDDMIIQSKPPAAPIVDVDGDVNMSK